MTTTFRKPATAIAAAAALTAALLVGAPSAGARPGAVAATYKVAPVIPGNGSYALEAGLNAVWALNADEAQHAQLYRIDPASHGMKLITTLPFPAGGLSVAFGSLWVTDYFGNAVWRLSPNGQVQAEIPTGLQPQWLHPAFGSMWVSNHHSGSLSRVDPATNQVIATVAAGAPDTFRSGPQDITDDGTKVYVDSSNLQALQSVDPATDTVTTPTSLDDQFCGPIGAIAGYVWSVDGCTGTTYQLGTDGTMRRAIASTGVPLSLTTAAGQLWIGDDTTVDPDTGQGSNAVLAQRDPVTGALLRTIAVGGDASALASGFGSLWVFDISANTIRRVSL
jgi:virginiamycin B lyase